MATSDDLLRLDAHLPGLGRIVYEATASEYPTDEWTATTLDARYSADGREIIDKIRVELHNGQIGSVSLPVAGTYALLALQQVRGEGSDCWYGIRLRITSEGECETTFDYNPQCAEDESFYDV